MISVGADRCRTRLNRCKNLSPCNEKDLTNADQVCGTDATTYKSMCHLQLATCL